MLQAINDRIKGWLGAAVVGLIALPFAFWGIQSYVGGGKELYAAKVNDVEISKGELDFNLAQQRKKITDKLDGKLPFDEQFLKKQVLDQLINRKVIESATYEAGYRVSDAELSDTIMKVFNSDGKFDRDLLERALQARGQSVSQFEYELRNDIRVTQMRAGLLNTAFATDDEIRSLVRLLDQSREASLLRFAMSDYMAEVSITDEEIRKVWEAQPERYMLPEKVSIEYVELKDEKLALDVEVDAHRIEQMYKDYVAEITRNEKRKASHILIKADPDKNTASKTLEELRQKLLSGASFEKLAEEYSQDSGSAAQGGDLGWVEPGQMVKPFEDALFGLQKDEVSDVVETEFGFHLIKLEDVEKQVAVPFEEKRVELENILKQDAVGNMFYDLSETMATTAYENPNSLVAVVETMDIPSQKTGLFTRETGEGIAANEKVRNAAFSKTVLEDGLNSEMIELGPDHVIVLRVREHKPASLRSLEEVSAQIEKNLHREKAHQLALQAAQAARSRIEAGEAVTSVAGPGQVLDRPGLLKRSDTGKLDAQALEMLFKLPHPEDGKVVAKEVSTYNGDVLLVALQRVVTPDTIEQDRIDSLKKQLAQDVAAQEISAVLTSLRASADIQINQRLFQK